MTDGHFDYEEHMKNYWKPRNEHLYDLLLSRKPGAHDEKKGHKHQSRAKAKEQFREELNRD